MDVEARTSDVKEYKLTLENATLFLLICVTEDIDVTGNDDAEHVARRMHSHLYSELFVCRSGATVIHTQEENIALCRGDIVILPSGVEHCCTDAIGTKRYTLSFDCKKNTLRDVEDVYQIVRHLCDAKSPVVLRNVPALTDRLAGKMENAFEQDSFVNRLSVAESLLSVAEQVFHTQKKTASHRELDINRLSVIDGVIHTHYMTDVSSASVAQRLFISERQLARIVKQKYGCSLKQAIINKRIAVAKQLLRGTDMSMEQIGYSVGFATRASFYRAFCAQLGVTPKEYRAEKEQQKS